MAPALQPPPAGRHARVFDLGEDCLSGQQVVSSLDHQPGQDLTPSPQFVAPMVHSLAKQPQLLRDQAQAQA